MTTVYVFAPWRRVEALVKNASVFAGVPYAHTEERHRIFDYSIPIMNSSYLFFYRKTAYPHGITYSNLNDLAGYRISGVNGYWYEEPFTKAQLKVEYVTADE